MIGSARKPAKTPSSVQAELDALEQERADAEAEYSRLNETREAVLLDGTDDDLRAHDVASVAAKNAAERAGLRYEKLLPTLDAAEQQAEQTRRRELYEDAKQRRADAVLAIEQYEEAARHLAKIAKRIALGNFMVDEANRSLPEGFERLEPAEPFNGSHPRPAEYAEVAAIRKDTGHEVMAYSFGDPRIIHKKVPTGVRRQVAPAFPGRPHRSFIYGLSIPSSANPEKPLF